MSAGVVATLHNINQAMREVGEAADLVQMRMHAIGACLLLGLHRRYRPQLLEERKKLQIIARRWRRAQTERNRRPALIHNGGKP